MSDYSELVKHLRASIMPSNNIKQHAADAIEVLEARAERAEAALKEAWATLEVVSAYARQCGWHIATASPENEVERDFAERLTQVSGSIATTISRAAAVLEKIEGD